LYRLWLAHNYWGFDLDEKESVNEKRELEALHVCPFVRVDATLTWRTTTARHVTNPTVLTTMQEYVPGFDATTALVAVPAAISGAFPVEPQSWLAFCAEALSAPALLYHFVFCPG
jgi:hypothetical protein